MQLSKSQKQSIVYSLLEKTFIDKDACLVAANAWIDNNDIFPNDAWLRVLNTDISKKGKTIIQIKDILNAKN